MNLFSRHKEVRKNAFLFVFVFFFCFFFFFFLFLGESVERRNGISSAKCAARDFAVAGAAAAGGGKSPFGAGILRLQQSSGG
jgi:hypothetical protein